MRTRITKALAVTGACISLGLLISTAEAATVRVVGGADTSSPGSSTVTVGVSDSFTLVIVGEAFNLVGGVADLGSFGVDVFWPDANLALTGWSVVSPWTDISLGPPVQSAGSLIGLNGGVLFALPPASADFDLAFLTFTAVAATGGPVTLDPILSFLGFTHFDGFGTPYTGGELSAFGATVIVTPIPPALLLFATAMGALGYIRRRRSLAV